MGLLSQHLFHQLSMHIGQAHVEALEADGKLCVIKAEQVLECGVQIVNMHGIFRDVEAEFIALPQGEAGF